MKMVQEMDMEMTMEALTAALPGPMKVSTKIVTTMTQKTGAADLQGNIEAEVTIDEASSETKTSMNGQPMASTPATNPMAGKRFSVVFDKEGRVVDTKFPSIPGLSDDAFKRMTQSFYGNMPTAAIGIGETTAVPLDLAIPLPLPGASEMKMDGEVKYKLVSIETQGGDRIATLDSTIDGKLVSDAELPSPAGKIKMSIDLKITGAGKAQNNLDKGLVKASESSSTFGGAIRMSGADPNLPQLPNMNMKATMKMTMTSED
jgi:hypothetical protein